MRRLMSTAKTTMRPAASPERNYMLDASAAIRQPRRQPCARQRPLNEIICLTPQQRLDNSINRRHRAPFREDWKSAYTYLIAAGGTFRSPDGLQMGPP